MLLHVFCLQNVLTAQQHKMSMSPQVIHAIPSPGTPVYDYGRKRYPAEIVIETEYGEVYVLLCLVMSEVIWPKNVVFQVTRPILSLQTLIFWRIFRGFMGESFQD